MKERNRLRVATQTARRRQIGSSAVLPLLFTPSLSSFHAPFCSALGCLFIYFSLSFFLSFSSHFSSPLHEEEGRNQEPVPCIAVPPRALRIGNLALLKLACALLFASPSWFRALRCWTVAPESPASQRKLMLQRDAVDVCCRTD